MSSTGKSRHTSLLSRRYTKRSASSQKTKSTIPKITSTSQKSKKSAHEPLTSENSSNLFSTQSSQSKSFMVSSNSTNSFIKPVQTGERGKSASLGQVPSPMTLSDISRQRSDSDRSKSDFQSKSVHGVFRNSIKSETEHCLNADEQQLFECDSDLESLSDYGSLMNSDAKPPKN